MDATEKQILVGFPCGHIFHLSCLLTYDNDEENVPESLNTESQGDERSNYLDRSVGTKVRHAKDLQPRVTQGCPVGIHKDKA